MEREALAARVRAAGMELRATAEVVEIGQTLQLPGAEVVLDQLIHDDGVLLLLWRQTRPDPPDPAISLLRRATDAKTVGYPSGPLLLLHPGPGETGLEIVFEQRRGRGALAALEGQARAEIALPHWDGGRALSRVRLDGAVVALAAFGHGGLGGRVDLVVETDPASGRVLAFGRPHLGAWVPKLDAVQTPLPPPLAQVSEPGPTRWAGICNSMPTSVIATNGRMEAAVTWSAAHARWDDRRGHERSTFSFLGPFPEAPGDLLFTGVTQWARIAPVILTFGEAQRGQAFDIPLGVHGATLELRVGEPYVREAHTALGHTFPAGRILPWRHRLRHDLPGTLAVALMERKGADAGFPERYDGPLYGMGTDHDGLNGWTHRSAVGPADGTATATIAIVAVGAPAVPVRLPLPGPPTQVRVSGAAARLAAARLEAAGLALGADAARVLDLAEARASPRAARGPTGPRAPAVDPWCVLCALVEDQAERPEGLLARLGVDPPSTLLLRMPRRRAAAAGQPRAPASLASEAERLVDMAAEEARAGGAATVGIGHLLLALLREPGHGRARMILEDAGLQLEPARRVVARDTDG